MKKIQYAKSGRFVSVREAERRLKCAERLQEMRKKASEEYRRRKEENMKEEVSIEQISALSTFIIFFN